MTSCPCGSGIEFENCCGPYIGGAPAPTPEALMRSRYTAFVQGEIDHIERTVVREEREKFDRAAAQEMSGSVDWLGLKILGTTAGGADDDTGTVDFEAHFRQKGERQVHRERSTFCREDGRWVYVDGDFDLKPETRRVEKIGRNQACPCGSGKKYKKCCGG
tara:strand:- start:806 stop:1288 length:483 start_codon:yes stop_codon:yes gene_type:complete